MRKEAETSRFSQNQCGPALIANRQPPVSQARPPTAGLASGRSKAVGLAVVVESPPVVPFSPQLFGWEGFY